MRQFTVNGRKYDFSLNGITKAHNDMLASKGQFTILKQDAKKQYVNGIHTFGEIIREYLMYDLDLSDAENERLRTFINVWKNQR